MLFPKALFSFVPFDSPGGNHINTLNYQSSETRANKIGVLHLFFLVVNRLKSCCSFSVVQQKNLTRYLLHVLVLHLFWCLTFDLPVFWKIKNQKSWANSANLKPVSDLPCFFQPFGGGMCTGEQGTRKNWCVRETSSCETSLQAQKSLIYDDIQLSFFVTFLTADE